MLAHDVEVLACRTFDDVFAAMNAGTVSAAVIPIENTLAGSIHRNYELLGASELHIAGEARLRIEHHLIARPGTKLEQVRRIFSHPVALAQCQRFLSKSNAEAIASDDTAGSVKLVMEGESDDAAAIAGAAAAELYGGEILVANVEDHRENYTRFLLLSKTPAEHVQGAMKTTVLFRTPNTPGSLWRALAAFALRDVNMTKLESRPIEGRPWEYSFYIDLAGGPNELANALNHLREMCEFVKVLGSYAAAAD